MKTHRVRWDDLLRQSTDKTSTAARLVIAIAAIEDPESLAERTGPRHCERSLHARLGAEEERLEGLVVRGKDDLVESRARQDSREETPERGMEPRVVVDVDCHAHELRGDEVVT